MRSFQPHPPDFVRRPFMPWLDIVLLCCLFAFNPFRSFSIIGVFAFAALAVWFIIKKRRGGLTERPPSSLISGRASWLIIFIIGALTLVLLWHGHPLQKLLHSWVGFVIGGATLMSLFVGMWPSASLTSKQRTAWRLGIFGVLCAVASSWAYWLFFSPWGPTGDTPFGLKEMVRAEAWLFFWSVMLYIPLAALQQYIMLHILRRARAWRWCQSDRRAAVVTAAFFALAHVPMWGLVLPCFVAGVAWYLFYLKTHSWVGVVLAHAVLAVCLFQQGYSWPPITSAAWLMSGLVS